MLFCPPPPLPSLSPYPLHTYPTPLTFRLNEIKGSVIKRLVKLSNSDIALQDDGPSAKKMAQQTKAQRLLAVKGK